MQTAAQIIETSSNRFFRVEEVASFDHAWLGVEVKRVKGGWVEKRPRLLNKVVVRKAATRVVEAA